jgi:8-oxo-dGTP pyrophosphatase MutT (NUDIX family)
MEQEIHPIQANVLLALLFEQRARFTDLNTAKIPSDHFNFHIRRLVKIKLIKKSKDNLYQLTKKGKEFANRFDTDSIVLERQAKIGVLICCFKEENNKTQYLIQQRLKEPYFGFYGFITGKVRWGETIKQTAERELLEETGLKNETQIVGIKHKMDYSQDGDLLEDKFFFVIKVDNPRGKLVKEFEGGKNLWLTEKQIMKLPNLFDGVDESLKMVKRNKLVFSEIKYKVKKY